MSGIWVTLVTSGGWRFVKLTEKVIELTKGHRNKIKTK